MDGWVKIGTELDTKSFDAQIDEVKAQLDEIEHKLKQADMGFEVGDTIKLEAQYEKLSNKLSGLIVKKQELDKQGLTNLEQSIRNVGEQTESTIKKVGKWAMAVFGVRSAYMGIRRAISLVRGQNEEIDASFKQIESFFATALEPIVKRIVGWMMTLLQYVNYISKAWFGVDLMAKSQEKSLKGANKQAKALQKTLTGFDEMNIINDSGGTGISGGGADVPNLPTPEDVPIPKWLEWIADNKDTIVTVATVLGALFIGAKIGNFISKLGEVSEGIFGVITNADKMKGVLGKAFVLTGVVLLIKGIYDIITGFDEMTGKERAIAIFTTAIGGAFIAMGASIGTGITLATVGIGALIGAAIGLIAVVGNYIKKTIDSKKEVASLEKAEERLKVAKENLKKATDDLNDATLNEIEATKRAEEAARELEEAEKRLKISGEDLKKQVDEGVLTYKDMNEKQREVYEKYIKNEKAQSDLKTATDQVTEATKIQAEAKKEEVRQSELTRLATVKEKEGLEKFRDETVKAAQSGKISWKDARDVIKKEMKGMSVDAKDTFLKDIPDNIKKGLEPSKFQRTMDSLKKSFGNLWSSLKSGASGLWDKAKGVFGFSSGGITVPKLATGGIINQPGRGVPLGRAIGGEAGSEGVIPLTDSQAMETLGEAIGKYISLNISNEVKMDGKVISREVKKINQNNDFVMNR